MIATASLIDPAEESNESQSRRDIDRSTMGELAMTMRLRILIEENRRTDAEVHGGDSDRKSKKSSWFAVYPDVHNIVLFLPMYRYID
jgi:hypothetical protein